MSKQLLTFISQIVSIEKEAISWKKKRKKKKEEKTIAFGNLAFGNLVFCYSIKHTHALNKENINTKVFSIVVCGVENTCFYVLRIMPIH